MAGGVGMGTHHDEIEKDQYDKINALSANVAGLASAVEISNNINLQLVALLKKVLIGAFIIILILLGALIFGAIGKEGLFAVRDSMPKVTQAIPWHNDFDRKWRVS